jgi:hypothetical protein
MKLDRSHDEIGILREHKPVGADAHDLAFFSISASTRRKSRRSAAFRRSLEASSSRRSG